MHLKILEALRGTFTGAVNLLASWLKIHLILLLRFVLVSFLRAEALVAQPPWEAPPGNQKKKDKQVMDHHGLAALKKAIQGNDPAGYRTNNTANMNVKRETKEKLELPGNPCGSNYWPWRADVKITNIWVCLIIFVRKCVKTHVSSLNPMCLSCYVLYGHNIHVL